MAGAAAERTVKQTGSCYGLNARRRNYTGSECLWRLRRRKEGEWRLLSVIASVSLPAAPNYRSDKPSGKVPRTFHAAAPANCSCCCN